ncbi:MAG: hypothetical protein PUE21_07215 [Lachnospiraceae bacterium]|nr:hypothetical protein [Lachnospiraceae bacterium]
MNRNEKIIRDYFRNKERMAELISYGLYRGKEVIRPESLIRIDGKYGSKTTIGEKLERDAFFFCMEDLVKYGLEVEQYHDFITPIRIMQFDSYEYRKEYLEMKKENEKQNALLNIIPESKSGMRRDNKMTPVITIVLYLGEGHFRAPILLKDCMVKAGTKYLNRYRMIQNYSVPVIEAEYINPSYYRTDLNLLFLAIKYRKDKEKLRNLFLQDSFQILSPEAQRMISISLKIEELENKVIEEGKNLCQAFLEIAEE